MTLLRAALAASFLVLGLAPSPAGADVALPKRGKEPQAPVERRTGRVPAVITLSPAGAATAPTHLVVTVPRDVLREVMGPMPVAGSLRDAGPPAPGTSGPGVTALSSGTRLRHGVVALALTLALAALPLALGGPRRTAAALGVALLLGGAVGTVASAHLAPSAAANARQFGPPRTIEFVIVPGKGPVRVEARYGR